MAPEFDPTQPFSYADAVAAGLTRRRLDGPEFRRLLHGYYVAASVPLTPALRAKAALAAAPEGAFLSHFSAARVRRVPVPIHPDEHVTVATKASRFRRADVRCHVRASARIAMVDGLAVSTETDLFTELASALNLVDLVVVGDHLVRRTRVTPQQLRDAAATLRGRVGRHARLASSFVRERVDSPMETRLRMLLVLAGIPEPEVNHTIRDVDGTPVRAYDLSWPRAGDRGVRRTPPHRAGSPVGVRSHPTRGDR